MEGLFDTIRQICVRETPQISFVFYTEARYMVFRDFKASFEMKLACIVIQTSGNQQIVQEAEMRRENRMQIDDNDESYHTKYEKILSQVDCNHCPECTDKFQKFKQITELDVCQITDLNDFNSHLNDLKQAGFCTFKYFPKVEVHRYGASYAQRYQTIIKLFSGEKEPDVPYIFGFEYYDVDDEKWNIFASARSPEKLEGSKFLLNLLKYN